MMPLTVSGQSPLNRLSAAVLLFLFFAFFSEVSTTSLAWAYSKPKSGLNVAGETGNGIRGAEHT